MVLSSVLGADVLLFLVIGLLGGAHCIGMCGPLVTIYASNMNPPRADGGTATATRTRRESHLSLYEVRQHALFNVGRTLSYTLIGVLMGTIGALFVIGAEEVLAATELVTGALGVVIGAIIVLIGAYYLGGRTTVGFYLPGSGRVTGWMTSLVERLASGPGIVGLGALHGLLPCPILYPAYLYAFTTGSPIAGGVALAALGIGTIPAVFLYGTIIDSVDAVHRQRIHRLLGVAFIVLGYILFAHGMMSLGYHIPHPELPVWNPLELPAGSGHSHH